MTPADDETQPTTTYEYTTPSPMRRDVMKLPRNRLNLSEQGTNAGGTNPEAGYVTRSGRMSKPVDLYGVEPYTKN